MQKQKPSTVYLGGISQGKWLNPPPNFPMSEHFVVGLLTIYRSVHPVFPIEAKDFTAETPV